MLSIRRIGTIGAGGTAITAARVEGKVRVAEKALAEGKERAEGKIIRVATKKTGRPGRRRRRHKGRPGTGKR
jgi:hypothetical protein